MEEFLPQLSKSVDSVQGIVVSLVVLDRSRGATMTTDAIQIWCVCRESRRQPSSNSGALTSDTMSLPTKFSKEVPPALVRARAPLRSHSCPKFGCSWLVALYRTWEVPRGQLRGILKEVEWGGSRAKVRSEGGEKHRSEMGVEASNLDVNWCHGPARDLQTRLLRETRRLGH